MSDRTLVDDEGENQAVRQFLLLYGGNNGGQLTTTEMREHLEMSGFDDRHWPQWAIRHVSLTKSGAQLWIRHLFALETQEPK